MIPVNANSVSAGRGTGNPVHAAIRAQTAHAALSALLGTAWIAAFLWAGPSRLPGAWGYAPALLGFGLIWYARRLHRNARARWHGLSVESRAISAATPILERRGWCVEAGLPSPYGDIDMAVSRGHGRVPIEIKSFRSWRGRDARCASAIVQATRQQQFLHAARGYIWLPEARVGWWRGWFGTSESEIRVVYGSARRLRRILARHEH